MDWLELLHSRLAPPWPDLEAMRRDASNQVGRKCRLDTGHPCPAWPACERKASRCSSTPAFVSLTTPREIQRVPMSPRLRAQTTAGDVAPTTPILRRRPSPKPAREAVSNGP